MTLTKNDIIPLTITALSNDGNGVGRYEGMAVFVPFTCVGDALRVRVVKVCKTHAFGIVESLVAAGEGRVEPDCEIYGKCGGCALAHLDYSAELKAKRQFVEDAMRRLGGIETPVQPVLASPERLRYRNKVQYPLTMQSGTVEYGFYAGRSHRVVACRDCRLQPELLNKIAAQLCMLLTRYGVTVYNEETHSGTARHIYLRYAESTGKVLVCLVINDTRLPAAGEICAALCETFPQIETIVLNCNTARTNVILGRHCITLTGDGVLHDTMCGVPVELTPHTFYQVNTRAAEQLYRTAARLAALQPHETLLDLYCGAGTIGLSMAHMCSKLIGVEIVADAVESAKHNAAKMGVEHAEFFCADAGEAAARLAQQGLRPDVIVLDPPRKGCDEPTLRAVCDMQPSRIVMISCNPATAARDIAALSAAGYAPDTIQPADLFPLTKHVEVCILMSRVER